MYKFNPFQAPSRYVWKDPDTGYEYVSADKQGLINHIRNYRTQNGLSEIDYLDMSIEDHLCRLPENVGKCSSVPLKRGWFEYVSGGMSLVKNMFYGEKNMVEKSEADRRAVICGACKYNTCPDSDLKAYDQWANSLAIASTGGKKTVVDDKLFNCEVCTCCLKAKVHSKGPFVLDNEQKKKMISVGCWQVEGTVDAR